ncbi:MAG: aspartate--tRNA ligase [Candidatus Omnitrophica bacterium]|nr:aspartate--tRNA ligase [Candidatus Omnitrophota bacterium]
MLRTHTCADLTPEDVNKEVTLCGWVKCRRDHGKLIFVDLRDRYGFIQVVFNPRISSQAYELAQSIRNEFVLKVKGIVQLRPKGTENLKIPTGKIELEAKELEILNSAQNLPFDIEGNGDISEELRFKYRYLDLRRSQILDNFIFRHKVCNIIRWFLDKEGFLEFSTPYLTKSTPEGARDFLIPSRLNPGLFYALPQSPQLFKQILMVGGVDRYYQIATCFRDEDLRQDRQLEFTQLDLEMSFVEEEDIFNLCERLMYQIFKQTKALEISLPFRRLTYEDAMGKYGTDKPDLRKEDGSDFSFVWVINFPLFKYNEEEKRWESEHHPFTAPKQEDIVNLDTSPQVVRARSYDLVLNGTEIASGSIRIHQRALQEKIFKIIGISNIESQKRFGFLLEAFQFGAPPHGGIAFGLDRLISILLGKESIREVILFPKTQKGICLLTEAPSEVENRQLKELKIKLDKNGR